MCGCAGTVPSMANGAVGGRRQDAGQVRHAAVRQATTVEVVAGSHGREQIDNMTHFSWDFDLMTHLSFSLIG